MRVRRHLLISVTFTAILLVVSAHLGGRTGGRKCIIGLCDGSANASSCVTCLRNLKKAGGAPRTAFHDCVQSTGCDNRATFKTCVTKANKDIAACIGK